MKNMLSSDEMYYMMHGIRSKILAEIHHFPTSTCEGDATTILTKMVSSYLMLNGYTETAEEFARATRHTLKEDMTTIKNRQEILKHVISGQIEQAMELTMEYFPGVLENNKRLLFILKRRQFIEMFGGSDLKPQTQTTPPNQTSDIQSTKSYDNRESTLQQNEEMVTTTKSAVINANNDPNEEDLQNFPSNNENSSISGEALSSSENNTNIGCTNDVDMDSNDQVTNDNTCKTDSSNDNSKLDAGEQMEVDKIDIYYTDHNNMNKRQKYSIKMSGSIPTSDIEAVLSAQKYVQDFERILELGKELSQMGEQLQQEGKMCKHVKQMLEDALGLIAYSDPWSSPLGWQLSPIRRRSVCCALSCAILDSLNYPTRPALETCVAHAHELLKTLSLVSLDGSGLISIEELLR